MKIQITWFDKLLRKFGYYIVLWERQWPSKGYVQVTHIGIKKTVWDADDKITDME